jgi:hypothetical protein
MKATVEILALSEYRGNYEEESQRFSRAPLRSPCIASVIASAVKKKLKIFVATQPN